MQSFLLEMLRCPATRQPLELKTIELKGREYQHSTIEEIWTGVLLSPAGFAYPVIDGVPRLLVEAMDDYGDFLKKHLPDFQERKTKIETEYGDVLKYARWKNNPTKRSFGFEWSLLNYDEDRVWHQNKEELLEQFYAESAETPQSIQGKWVLDAGCGHGILSGCVGGAGAQVLGMDMSLAIERAYSHNDKPNVHFIQGDVMFPPLALQQFDLVHSSGVIHHTHNTELTFSILHELVKSGGSYCVWLYHPIPGPVHGLFTFLRPMTCRLPLRLQFWLYFVFLLAPVWLVKRYHGKKHNWREVMIDLIDGLSPRYRYEHSPNEARGWYQKRGYKQILTSTKNLWGFSIVGQSAP